MAEFCVCGSIMINGSCTNKNCINKSAGKPAAKPSARAKAGSGSAAAKKAAAPSKTRKSSKCITYNLNDLEKEENVQ